ncbi:hypothetical protein [Candidatus Chazhemtobacterium aquaticus]|uniref:Uncharacterized protein n=1 Tax=Candidatus Chazhemtobacterium aquaticus TaxID=2715735 RepID=A0A857NB53_9BACT|nr:hypothetical protein [Candidatus Chazhemtobacterium aquaticus]QHO63162.1 hypothetical protein MICH65_0181 [Candidatus Chazhemtobacterium aquaticus]
MKKTIKKATSVKKITKKIEKAKQEYKKIYVDMGPFIPETKREEITTEGKWRTTSSLSLY